MAPEHGTELFRALAAFRRECALKPASGARERIAGVDTIVHRPETGQENLPAVLVMHGGSWIGGDAVQIDSLCETLARNTPAAVINVNYTKVDERPYPYPVEQVLAVAEYVARYPERFGASPDRLVLCGMSAGGHIAAAAAIAASRRRLRLARQVLVYPFLDWSGLIDNPLEGYGVEGIPCDEFIRAFFPGMAPDEAIMSPMRVARGEARYLAPADIIICGDDDIRAHGAAYHQKLISLGAVSTLIEYPRAMHGFLEVNRPDCVGEYEAASPEQARYARACEDYICALIRRAR